METGGSQPAGQKRSRGLGREQMKKPRLLNTHPGQPMVASQGGPLCQVSGPKVISRPRSCMWNPRDHATFPVAPLPVRQVPLTPVAPTCPHSHLSHLCDHKTPRLPTTPCQALPTNLRPSRVPKAYTVTSQVSHVPLWVAERWDGVVAHTRRRECKLPGGPSPQSCDCSGPASGSKS